MDEDPSSLDFVPIPDELIEFIKPELEPGERLLWAAVSKPRSLIVRPTGIRPLLLALGCLVISSVLFFAIFGPFRLRLLKHEDALIGAGVGWAIAGVVALFMALDAWAKYRVERDSVPKRTYALSDRRAVTWSPVKGSLAVEVFTFPAGTLEQVHRLEYPDGSGDVLFDESPPDFDEDVCGSGQSGFFGIDNVRRVEELVRKTLVQPRLNRER